MDLPHTPVSACPGLPAIDGNVEQLRALVASLECAVGFARAVADSVPLLTQLLASSTLTDVQETIALLIAFRRFRVEGAEAAIRKMLPLVFAREQGPSVCLVLGVGRAPARDLLLPVSPSARAPPCLSVCQTQQTGTCASLPVLPLCQANLAVRLPVVWEPEVQLSVRPSVYLWSANRAQVFHPSIHPSAHLWSGNTG
jgi:hypothetical protein